MALNHYLKGGRVVMVGTCDIVDPLTDAKTPTDPTTVTFTREIDAGAPTTYTNGDPEVVKLADGVWSCTVSLDVAGEERWRFAGTGACQAVAEDAFVVYETSLT